MDRTAKAAASGLFVRARSFLGGPVSVDPSIEARLRGMGLSVTRVGGNDRYATSYDIAQYGYANNIVGKHFVSTATGLKFPDALTGGVGAGERSGVVLLTTPMSMHPLEQRLLRDNKFDTCEFNVVGGPMSVAETVMNQARTILLTPTP